jgi:predicted  nucleic acid-binding Zn-ribbon protein
MNPEMQATTTTSQHYVNMPRINSPFNAYNLQQTAFANQVGCATPKTFPSMHMASPWNTAQYMQSQYAQSYHMQAPSHEQMELNTQKPTAWGASTIPPVDIEVLATPDPVTQQNTKVAWTSAEQLADAIFPSNLDHVADSIKPLHEGLLDHKSSIEKLHHGALNHKTEIESLHHGVLNHKTEIESLHHGVLNHNTEIENLHLGVLNHKTEIESLHMATASKKNDIENLHVGVLNHRDEIQELWKSKKSLSSMINKQQQHTATHNMLHSAHEAKLASLKNTVTATKESASALESLTKNHASLLKTHTETLNSVNKQQQEHCEGLINHRNTLRDVVSTQDKLKSKSLKQEQSLLSMQSEISDIKNNIKRTSPDESTPKRLVDLHERTRDLEAKVSSLVSSNNALVSSNNVINSHIEKLQAQSSSDKQVQMVFAPRRH